MKKMMLNSSSPELMEVRMGVHAAIRFLIPLVDIINMGYAERSNRKGKAPLDLAVSQVCDKALMGWYPDLFVNPEKVLLSRGTIAQVVDVRMHMNVQRIKVSFQSDENMSNGRLDDEVILCAYNPVNRMVWLNNEMACRSNDAVYLETTSTKVSDELHLYLMVCDRERRKFANSKYLGTWVIKEN